MDRLGRLSGLIDHVAGDHHRTLGPDGERDGVGRARVEDESFRLAGVVPLDVDFRVERSVCEVIDPNPVYRAAEFGKDLNEQVVCQGTVKRLILENRRDRPSLVAADEDWKILFSNAEDNRRDVAAGCGARPDSDDLGFVIHTVGWRGQLE